MNKTILMGRLTKDPDVRVSQGESSITIARYTLAVDRRKTKTNAEPGADFVSIVAFGSNGEFAEKYLKKGTKVVVEGRIQTGSYTNKDGLKVYTTDVVVESQEFAESKRGMSEEDKNARDQAALEGYSGRTDENGFLETDGMDEELPFT
jgi:single-strand DNA-binding protein